jgi:hypothetical protein
MSTKLKLILGGVLFMASAAVTSTAIADQPAAPASATKLKVGLSPVAQLVQLMDTDKNGKVSKEEFMRFMEAEFDLADEDKNGELDPKELQHFINRISHPVRGPGR